jgi:hypothetical protein
MNLIQIQEHLKDLPTQAIMSYANGQNPQVPPYMALGEMNRRKAMEQRAAQAPDSSVKEKLESELSQQVALPGVGQGMNMRMNPAGMPPPVPAAQPQMAPKMPGMPVPPMAPKMPPQQMAQPGSIPAGAPGMAAGGLAELPMRKDIFNYAPGGIVAFADEGLVPAAVSDEAVATGGAAPDASAGVDELPVGLANKILADRLAGKSNLPMPVSRDQARSEVLAAKPELAGIIDKLPGDTLTKLAAKLEEQNTAQRARFQEGEGRQGLAALSNALISAGEATRGRKGLGAAFGGFGKAYNTATAASEERAAKQQALERAQTIETMKLQSDIEQMQRAFAEGRIDEAMKLKEQVNARQAKIEEIKGVTAKDVLTQSMTQQQRDEQMRHNKEVEKYQQMQAATAAQRAKFEREDRPTGEDKKLTKVMTALNNDPQYKALLKRQTEFNPADPEFDAIQDVLDSIRKAAFADAKLTAPTQRERLKSIPKPEEKGFFANLFGGSSPSSSKAVPFDQLPK